MIKCKSRLLLGIIIAAILMIFCGCSSDAIRGLLISHSSSKEAQSDAVRFASEYTGVSKNNIFIYTPAEQVLKIFEKGYGVVFLGFPECKWCQAYAPILEKVAKANGIQEIYYYNIKEDREKNSDIYNQLVKYTKDYLDLDKNNKERIYVPDVYFIKKGKIIGHNNDTSVIKGDIEPKAYWTDVRKAELASELECYIKELQADNGCDECGK